MPVPTVLMCVRDNAATLDRQLGALAAQDIGYLASGGFVAGRVAELVQEATPSRPRTDA